MKKMNTENLQKAFIYALFMICSSYFDKQPVCTNEVFKKRLYLYYKDTPVNTQYELERLCINYIEKDLRDILPVNFWTVKREEALPKVRFVSSQGGHCTEIQFQTERYILRLMGRYDAKRNKADFQFKFFWNEKYKLGASPKIIQKIVSKKQHMSAAC